MVRQHLLLHLLLFYGSVGWWEFADRFDPLGSVRVRCVPDPCLATLGPPDRALDNLFHELARLLLIMNACILDGTFSGCIANICPVLLLLIPLHEVRKHVDNNSSVRIIVLDILTSFSVPSKTSGSLTMSCSFCYSVVFLCLTARLNTSSYVCLMCYLTTPL